jgi:hypothetical protein
MTPKEKAEELFNKFRKQFDWVESDYPIDLYRDTRQCALIAVQQILEIIFSDYDWQYWNEVKQELEKL